MALFLKYRPKDFKSIVWQDFVKETLSRAVKDDKTVWAYLLCGPRGTWKTSTARILAKAVNCKMAQDWNPCNNCEICKSIDSENLVDVIEIDAASNTWVDNIREIISKASFRPTNAKYKIYIIDEVHMLSTWAFNALLKILEEPPEFVKFILATTENHKVPETIISRCQRYDFKNISLNDLKSRLEYIAKEEKIKTENKALDYIVKNSAGWLRNAISLFEQMISNNEITYQNIINTLWVIPEEKLESFLEKLKNKDSSIIDDYEELISRWKNLKLFFKDLIFYTKNKSIELLKKGSSYNNELSILEELNETYSKTKNTLDENTTFLIWLLSILRPKNTIDNFHPKEEKITKNILNKKEIEVEKELKLEKEISIKNKDTEIKKTEKIEVKNEIEIEDIWDIFWEESQKKEENKKLDSGSNIFDKKLFTDTLKSLWAKWWLTMSIRWADCYNDKEKLNIKFKTQFALKSVNNSDNIALMKQALEKMGNWDLEIKLS